MVRENKDLSVKQAQKIIDENRKVNEKENNDTIFEKFRQQARQD